MDYAIRFKPETGLAYQYWIDPTFHLLQNFFGLFLLFVLIHIFHHIAMFQIEGKRHIFIFTSIFCIKNKILHFSLFRSETIQK